MAEARTVVTMQTSEGAMEIELFAADAPETVKNFLRYVDEGFYNGTIFHRVIPGFMVQGGGFTAKMAQKRAHAAIKNEAGNGLSNARGTLAMARTSDPDSATAQFFINVSDNTFLDRAEAQDGCGYTVFGRIIKGMDVVDEIVAAPTATVGGHRDVPRTPITITAVIKG